MANWRCSHSCASPKICFFRGRMGRKRTCRSASRRIKLPSGF
jgi:hypothetical protein